MGSEPASLHDRSRNVSKTDTQTIGDQVDDDLLNEVNPDKCERHIEVEEDCSPREKLQRIRNAKYDE